MLKRIVVLIIMARGVQVLKDFSYSAVDKMVGQKPALVNLPARLRDLKT